MNLNTRYRCKEFDRCGEHDMRDFYYFSHLIPKQHKIVDDFIKSCTKARSYFVGIERRCKCIIWASTPKEKLLSSFCLVEVLIDKSHGGNFTSCQFMIDHYFKILKLSNNVTYNRIPYAIEELYNKYKSENPQRFYSTLSRLYNVRHVSDILKKDMIVRKVVSDHPSGDIFTFPRPDKIEENLEMIKENLSTHKVSSSATEDQIRFRDLKANAIMMIEVAQKKLAQPIVPNEMTNLIPKTQSGSKSEKKSKGVLPVEENENDEKLDNSKDETINSEIIMENSENVIEELFDKGNEKSDSKVISKKTDEFDVKSEILSATSREKSDINYIKENKITMSNSVHSGYVIKIGEEGTIIKIPTDEKGNLILSKASALTHEESEKLNILGNSKELRSYQIEIDSEGNAAKKPLDTEGKALFSGTSASQRLSRASSLYTLLEVKEENTTINVEKPFQSRISNMDTKINIKDSKNTSKLNDETDKIYKLKTTEKSSETIKTSKLESVENNKQDLPEAEMILSIETVKSILNNIDGQHSLLGSTNKLSAEIKVQNLVSKQSTETGKSTNQEICQFNDYLSLDRNVTFDTPDKINKIVENISGYSFVNCDTEDRRTTMETMSHQTLSKQNYEDYNVDCKENIDKTALKKEEEAISKLQSERTNKISHSEKLQSMPLPENKEALIVGVAESNPVNEEELQILSSLESDSPKVKFTHSVLSNDDDKKSIPSVKEIQKRTNDNILPDNIIDEKDEFPNDTKHKKESNDKMKSYSALTDLSMFADKIYSGSLLDRLIADSLIKCTGETGNQQEYEISSKKSPLRKLLTQDKLYTLSHGSSLTSKIWGTSSYVNTQKQSFKENLQNLNKKSSKNILTNNPDRKSQLTNHTSVSKINDYFFSRKTDIISYSDIEDPAKQKKTGRQHLNDLLNNTYVSSPERSAESWLIYDTRPKETINNVQRNTTQKNKSENLKISKQHIDLIYSSNSGGLINRNSSHILLDNGQENVEDLDNMASYSSSSEFFDSNVVSNFKPSFEKPTTSLDIFQSTDEIQSSNVNLKNMCRNPEYLVEVTLDDCQKASNINSLKDNRIIHSQTDNSTEKVSKNNTKIRKRRMKKRSFQPKLELMEDDFVFLSVENISEPVISRTVSLTEAVEVIKPSEGTSFKTFNIFKNLDIKLNKMTQVLVEVGDSDNNLFTNYQKANSLKTTCYENPLYLKNSSTIFLDTSNASTKNISNETEVSKLPNPELTVSTKQVQMLSNIHESRERINYLSLNDKSNKIDYSNIYSCISTPYSNISLEYKEESDSMKQNLEIKRRFESHNYLSKEDVSPTFQLYDDSRKKSSIQNYHEPQFHKAFTKEEWETRFETVLKEIMIKNEFLTN